MTRISGLVFVCLLFFGQSLSAAQGSQTTVRCGDIIEGQFLKQNMHNDYLIKMQPGDVIKFSAVAVGDVLRLWARIYEPSGNRILQTESSQHLRGNTSVLSAPGEYRLEIYNQSAGVYTLHMGCILRDGTEVQAGSGGAVGTGGETGAQGAIQGLGSALGSVGQDLSTVVGGYGPKSDELSLKIARTTNQIDQAATGVEKIAETYYRIRSMFPRRKKKKRLQEQMALGVDSGAIGQSLVAPPSGGSTPVVQPPPAASPAAPEVAFPTLPLDLSLGGSLIPGVSEVFGFHVEAEAGSRAALELRRTAGNLGLGVQLLAPGGATLYQSTLMGDAPMASALMFPVAGKYTVKVLRTDLAPVEQPQMTMFHIGLEGSGP